MRISDWSSDVCSSDLVEDAGQRVFDDAQHFHVCPVDEGLHADTPLADRGDHADGQARREHTAVAGGGHIVADLHLGGRPEVEQFRGIAVVRSEEHTSELQSLMRISYAVFCLKKKK